MTAASPAEDSATVRPVGRFEWEHLLRRIRLPKNTKYVAFVVATYADPDGTRIRPGYLELVAATECSESTVRRALTALSKWGFLGLVSRGGGRGGKGKASEYRLTIPVDLLERFEVLPPGGASRRGPLAVVKNDSPVTKVTAQSAPESPVTQTTDQSPDPASNDRSKQAGSELMTGQNVELTGHPDDQLPATRPTTTDHNPGPDPTQPTTAHEPADAEEIDHVELKPPKCIHGLRAHILDGQPTCPLCRRVPAVRESA